MATKKRSKKNGELALEIGGKDKSIATVYTDANGKRIEAIRCGQCKGKGCDGCDGLGFLKQGILI